VIFAKKQDFDSTISAKTSTLKLLLQLDLRVIYKSENLFVSINFAEYIDTHYSFSKLNKLENLHVYSYIIKFVRYNIMIESK